MEQSYPAYRAIHMDTWARREHFAYYRHQIRCGYSLTVWYTEQDSVLTLPVSLTISHTAADGYHSSVFFQKLQENLNQLGETD